MTTVVLGVDGGNSKTDVALADANGALLARVLGPTVSHQVIGARAGGERLAELVNEARARAGLNDKQVPRVGTYCLAGADFPSDMRKIKRELKRHALADDELLLNDCFAPLRAGAVKGWGVVLICGQGINAAGIGPTGRTARFAGIGDLSGDWGGGGGLGQEALALAIRARDGRGRRTSLERVVAEHFSRRTPEQVMLAMYEDRLSSARLNELAPAVFREAERGDQVARDLIDRLADELAAMANALIRRLRVTREEVDIVLAGGVFNAAYERFYERLRNGILSSAPRARLVRPHVPPVAGAVLLGLDRLDPTGHATGDVVERLTSELAKRGAAPDD
jgi:N-acetylglucosamine kinase-like BadF-type ATPase